ncbi:pyruvate dehydrogenase [Methanomicrobiaceae archaeon CYW5]|uniref:thiamine pyrophosphate-dependent enzyme n=1 Tax=Methanovulcanius yangii TaxID=1789227 RepID=UPI0029C9CA52|nr:thiamine pyrophosphate-dependent enzyme [Methanovulcanius yangii]MBT8507236.1 pyruvate dehydrogenase [Methanovulcanius yangii]
MAGWKCTVCGYIYNEEKGEESMGIAADTAFTDLPSDWTCPVCGAPKSAFEKIDTTDVHADSEKTVSDVIITELDKWGVRYVFGLPGTSSLGLVDALRKNDSLRYIVVRHEENAAMAASAYNKLTGKIAACLTIAGPGATNLATGLYDAQADHASVLSLNGQVQIQYSGPGGFQEIDQDAFFRPMTVYNNTIYDKEKTVILLTRAMKYATLEHGVAQLSIPNNIQKLPLKLEYCRRESIIANPFILPESSLIEKAAERINASENPVIIAGWGACGAAEEVVRFASTIAAPIATTFRAKGILPENHPWSVGILGSVGAPSTRDLVREADLLITLGVGFSTYTNVPLDTDIIQVDINPIKLGISPRAYPLWGECSLVTPALQQFCIPREPGGVLKIIADMKHDWNNQRDHEADASAVPVRPPFIMKTLSEIIPDDAVITVDVGENQWWFGRNFRMQHQRFAMSGYLAAMGFGLPAAIAGKLAYPDKDVLCITGDGGFSMAMAEFVTAVKYDLPIVVVILNNKQLGMIQVEQMTENYPNYATELLNPDFAEYARACGGFGIKVEKPDKLKQAVSDAFGSKLPAIVDIATDARRFPPS